MESGELAAGAKIMDDPTANLDSTLIFVSRNIFLKIPKKMPDRMKCTQNAIR